MTTSYDIITQWNKQQYNDTENWDNKAFILVRNLFGCNLMSNNSLSQANLESDMSNYPYSRTVTM